MAAGGSPYVVEWQLGDEEGQQRARAGGRAAQLSFTLKRTLSGWRIFRACLPTLMPLPSSPVAQLVLL